MSARRRIFAVGIGLAVCLGLVWYSGLIQARSRTYELRPEIRLPEQRTDAARAIDAYERLMERYMTLTEKNLSGINVDVRGVGKKLDSIDGRLGDLSRRMARITVPSIVRGFTPMRPSRACRRTSGTASCAPISTVSTTCCTRS